MMEGRIPGSRVQSRQPGLLLGTGDVSCRALAGREGVREIRDSQASREQQSKAVVFGDGYWLLILLKP